MPMNRTPPASGSETFKPNTRTRSKKHLAVPSDTDAPLTGSDEESQVPAKQQVLHSKSSTSAKVTAEMKILFDGFATQQNNKIDEMQQKLNKITTFPDELLSLRADVNNGRKEVSEFMQACMTRIDQLENRILEVEKKLEQQSSGCNDTVQDALNEMRLQLNDRDQELLLNDLEIYGVPESADERPVHVVKLLSTALGLDIDDREIVHVERTGSNRRNRVEGVPSVPRPIVVRLARRSSRDQILQAARVRRGLTTASLDVGVKPPQPVYVNERLTRTNRRLLGKVRDQARKNGWKYVWTRDGKILARQEVGKLVMRFRSEKDLIKNFGIDAV